VARIRRWFQGRMPWLAVANSPGLAASILSSAPPAAFRWPRKCPRLQSRQCLPSTRHRENRQRPHTPPALPTRSGCS